MTEFSSVCSYNILNLADWLNRYILIFFISLFLSFIPSHFLPHFSTMLSNYRKLVGWLTKRNSKNFATWLFCSNRVNDPEFFCRTEKEKVQIRSATVAIALRIKIRVITWSNALLCLAKIIIKDN
jgi:hypothetical protein